MTILVKEIFDSYPYTLGNPGSIRYYRYWKVYNGSSVSPPHPSFKKVANTFLMCLLWGLVMQFMAGYFFLHSWSNLFGELLTFADREFYSVS